MPVVRGTSPNKDLVVWVALKVPHSESCLAPDVWLGRSEEAAKRLALAEINDAANALGVKRFRFFQEAKEWVANVEDVNYQAVWTISKQWAIQ